MKQLIKSEIKKIFKFKINVVLTVIAIVGTILSVGMEYSENTKYMHRVQNEAKEELSGLGLLRYVDKIRHQYAGEWTAEKSQQYFKDFQELMEKHFTKELDKDQMKRAYGKNYNELMEKSLKRELTFKELHENNVANKIGDNYEVSQAEELVDITLYYKQNPILVGYQYAYGIGDVSYEYNEEALSSLLKLIDKFLLDKEFKFNSSQVDFITSDGQYSKEDMMVIQDYLQEKGHSVPPIFESTIGNEMLIRALNESLWLPLICIMIVLANTFGMEKQYQMEQLIYPTKSSHFKITIAKLLAGTLFSVGLIMIVLALGLILGYILLPIHTWNVTTFELYNLFSMANILGFTYGNILLSAFVLSIVASLAVTTLTLGLSYITKNRFIVIIILFLYFGAVIFFNLPNILFFSHPYTMSHALNYIAYDRMPYYVYNQMVISYATMTILFWLVVLIGVYVGIIMRARTKVARTVQ